MSSEARERLQELDAAEAKVQRILSATSETLSELGKLPLCDHNRINALADEYLDHVLSVKASVLRSISYIEGSGESSSSSSSGALEKEVASLQDLLKDVLDKVDADK